MRFIFSLLITAILAYLAGYYLPWWTVAIAAALGTWLFPQRVFYSILSAFLSVGLLWFLLAGYIDLRNQHILSRRIGELFFHTSNSMTVLLATAFIGALTAALGAWCAALLRSSSSRKKTMTFGKFYRERF
ncbi:MAG: hypothetical protein K6T34_08705 [Thermoflavifilum sp.]|nr:hypothetical protein [Thermoflavifilum sp.]